MKNKSIITMLILCMGLGMATTSCEDMLSPDSERHSYVVANDTLYSYWGILKSLQNVAERYVILGECRGDLVSGTDEFTTDSIKAILDFGQGATSELIKDGSCRYLQVSDYYHVINSCNAYLAACDTTWQRDDGKQYMIREYAQVEAIRAWTYLQLVINYGSVPFYTEPLLTTEQIENFQGTRATADNLWQLLGDKLQRAAEVERTEGFPQYDNYGYTSTVCHSTKAMFPSSVVLGDIYLLGNQYEKAAASYYDYLYYSGTGGVLPQNYYSYGWLKSGESEDFSAFSPTYSHINTPYTEKGKVTSSAESITCIPSSTNKLWGTVLRGVNDLFGFESKISVNTQDSTTSASITLSQNWERQLGASEGYDNLTQKQKYEVYLGQTEEIAKQNVTVVPGMRDARACWLRTYSGNYNDVQRIDRYVMKQNPSGVFTTTYPMIYRKSTVWLRFAEAINRAGYPSYAFAVLKNGFCKNEQWVPREASQEASYTHDYKIVGIQIIETGEIIPEDYQTNPDCKFEYDEETGSYDLDKLVRLVAANRQYLYERDDEGNVLIDEETGDTIIKPYKIVEDTYYKNYPVGGSFICDYINRNEFKKAIGVSWLNFYDNKFEGSSSYVVQYQKTLQDRSTSLSTASTSSSNLVVRGIHSRGCGLLDYNESKSSYNYVDCVAEKYKEETGTVLTKQDLYNLSSDNKQLQNAVEDLIVDEEGLELAFEGSRFFDLLRAARHRGDDSYIGKMISTRDADAATWAKSLRGGGVSNTGSVYLPLPDNSNR